MVWSIVSKGIRSFCQDKFYSYLLPLNNTQYFYYFVSSWGVRGYMPLVFGIMKNFLGQVKGIKHLFWSFIVFFSILILPAQVLAVSLETELGSLEAKPEALATPSVTAVAPKAKGQAKASKKAQEGLEVKKQKKSSGLKGGVRRFGIDLFSGEPTTFAPVNDITIPVDYLLGPGDQLKIQLYGNAPDFGFQPEGEATAGKKPVKKPKPGEILVVVDRNGKVSLPGLSPIFVAGLQLKQAIKKIKRRVRHLGFGVKANVTLAALRSYRIFVMGESKTPGSYLVSGLSTITQALYISGGVSKIGSLRNIQLKRHGKTITNFDVYDFLIKGDNSRDLRLMPGDVIFIPPVKKQVTVIGAVIRPAIYELKKEKTLAEVLALAGGAKSTAYLPLSKLTRITKAGFRTVFDVDLTKSEGLNKEAKDGDILNVQSIRPEDELSISLKGEVFRQGRYQWHQNLRLLDILPSPEKFLSSADLSYLLVLREERKGHFVTKQLNWNHAYAHPESQDNIKLMPKDKIFVLSKYKKYDRDKLIKPILKTIKKQATSDESMQLVESKGQLKFPSKYPLVKNMRVKDLVVASGRLVPGAVEKEADIIRYRVDNGVQRAVERISFNLSEALAGNPRHNIKLQPYDQLVVRKVSGWQESMPTMSIQGEVKFPGTYTIRPGETLQDILVRAGGFTPWADPKNAVFTRSSLKKLEKSENRKFAHELQKNLVIALKRDTNLAGEQSRVVGSLGMRLVKKIIGMPALGRLVIALDPHDSKKQSMFEATMKIEVQNQDALVIPKRSSEVAVLGEVSRSTSILYQPGLTVEDYLESSGGLTERADRDLIYVVHGDGSVEKLTSDLFGSHKVEVKAGDTIVVPMDIHKINSLVNWSSVSKILANFAVTTATLKTLGAIQ